MISRGAVIVLSPVPGRESMGEIAGEAGKAAAKIWSRISFGRSVRVAGIVSVVILILLTLARLPEKPV